MYGCVCVCARGIVDFQNGKTMHGILSFYYENVAKYMSTLKHLYTL